MPYATRLSSSAACRHECVVPVHGANQRDRRRIAAAPSCLARPSSPSRPTPASAGTRSPTTTGSYTLSNLPIGPYRLEVTLSGFRTYVQTGIVLQVNSNPVLRATLQLGDLAETVTVVGESPLVEIRNPAVGQVDRQRADRGVAARGPQSHGADRAGGRRGGHGRSLQPQHDDQPRDCHRRRPGVRRRVPARRGDAQQRLRRIQHAAAVPRRAAGVPGRDQLAERAERRFTPAERSASSPSRAPTRSTATSSSSRATTVSTRPARSPGSTGPPASASMTAWCATSSAARWEARSCGTSCFSLARIRAPARPRHPPTPSPSCRPPPCSRATSRRSPRPPATRAARSSFARRS